jgi:hypothetical protein
MSGYFSDEDGAVLQAIGRHREQAPQMYSQRIGLAIHEERAMRWAIRPLLAEIDRLGGYCKEWERKVAELEAGAVVSGTPPPEKIRVGDLLHDRDCDKFSERGVCSCGALVRAVKDAAK